MATEHRSARSTKLAKARGRAAAAPNNSPEPEAPAETEELMPAAVVRVDETGISLDIWERTKPTRINWDIVDESLSTHGLVVGQAVTVLVNKAKTGRPQVSWVQSWGQGRI